MALTVSARLADCDANFSNLLCVVSFSVFNQNGYAYICKVNAVMVCLRIGE